MCKRFALDLDWDAIAAQFSVAKEDVRGDVLPRPSYNITPTQNIAVIAQGKDGHRHLTGAYWSLIPSWSSGKTLPYPTYNARVESAPGARSFRRRGITSGRGGARSILARKWNRRRLRWPGCIRGGGLPRHPYGS